MPLTSTRARVATDKHFSLAAAALREFHRPLLLGLVFVIVDGLMTLLDRCCETGLDDGVAKGSSVVLFAAAGVFLVVTSSISSTRLVNLRHRTHRAAIMLSLRIRIWDSCNAFPWTTTSARWPVESLTRMTTDVDQFNR